MGALYEFGAYSNFVFIRGEVMNKCRKQSQYVHSVLIGFVGAQANMGTIRHLNTKGELA